MLLHTISTKLNWEFTRVAKFKLRKQNECQIFYKQQHGACNLHGIPKIKLIFIYFIPAIPIYSILHGPYMVINKTPDLACKMLCIVATWVHSL